MISELELPFVDFPLQIEKIVHAKNCTYMEAVILWCEDSRVELEVGGELVKKYDIIREQIQNEAEDLNFLPKTARLF